MKRYISAFLLISTILASLTICSGAQSVEGLVDSGINYAESVRYIGNPMMGSEGKVRGIKPRISGNTPTNDSGFVFFYIDMQYFAAGYTLDKDGNRQPLTDEQKNDRVKGGELNTYEWNNNNRNHGGPDDIPISDDAIECLRKTFSNLRDNGGTGYIRMNYGINAEVNNEPYDFDIMLTHVRQMSALVTEFSDVIGMIECGTIGPFGEMHSSPYSSPVYANEIIDTWLNNTPSDVKLLVRTPTYIMNYIIKIGSTLEKKKYYI